MSILQEIGRMFQRFPASMGEDKLPGPACQAREAARMERKAMRMEKRDGTGVF